MSTIYQSFALQSVYYNISTYFCHFPILFQNLVVSEPDPIVSYGKGKYMVDERLAHWMMVGSTEYLQQYNSGDNYESTDTANSANQLCLLIIWSGKCHVHCTWMRSSFSSSQ